jgi:hypothetical protein
MSADGMKKMGDSYEWFGVECAMWRCKGDKKALRVATAEVIT